MKTKLKRLIRQWRRKEREFQKASRKEDYETPLDRARYEGVGIAHHWCADDIQKLVDEPDSPPYWVVGDIWEARVEFTRSVYEVVEIKNGIAGLKMISPFAPNRIYTQKKIPKTWRFLSHR